MKFWFSKHSTFNLLHQKLHFCTHWQRACHKEQAQRTPRPPPPRAPASVAQPRCQKNVWNKRSCAVCVCAGFVKNTHVLFAYHPRECRTISSNLDLPQPFAPSMVKSPSGHSSKSRSNAQACTHLRYRASSNTSDGDLRPSAEHVRHAQRRMSKT